MRVVTSSFRGPGPSRPMRPPSSGSRSRAGACTSQDFNPGQITNPYPPPQAVPQFAIDVAGFAQQYLMLEPVAVSASGAESLDAAQSVAIRDFYLFDDTGSTYPGQIAAVVSIPGTLAIAADIGPIVKFLATATPKSIHASVKQAPTGAAITVVVYAGSDRLRHGHHCRRPDRRLGELRRADRRRHQHPRRPHDRRHDLSRLRPVGLPLRVADILRWKRSRNFSRIARCICAALIGAVRRRRCITPRHPASLCRASFAMRPTSRC